MTSTPNKKKTSPTYTYASRDDELIALRSLARELFDHLEYVNWGGNVYEREVSKKLREKAREEFEK